MANSWFKFKQFTIQQDQCAMKVTTDACLFGGFVATAAPKQAVYVLDVGTGTGLLALMFAQKNRNAIIDAIEIDTEAAEQAKENILHSPWNKSITVTNDNAIGYQSDKKYDIIISNPPFYENELKSGNKKKNLAHHNEGLLLSDLLTIIKNNLHPTGLFYLLLPYKRNEEMIALLKEHKMSIHKLVFVRQTINHEYFRIIISGSFKTDNATETVLEEISIKDEDDEYTGEFTFLLKEYYLYL